jgi:hypothetical protein
MIYIVACGKPSPPLLLFCGSILFVGGTYALKVSIGLRELQR